MYEDVRAMVRDLRGAETFEAAAGPVLVRAAAVAEAGLAEGAFAGRGRVVRAVVHLRGGDVFRAVGVWDAEGGAAEGERRHESSTAWRWVEAHDAPVEIDVLLGRAHLADRPETVLADASARPDATFGGGPTRDAMLRRGTTHVLVVPLHGADGAPVGMLSVEAVCRAAMGRGGLWDRSLRAVEAIADVAGPALATKPVRESGGAEAADPLLPVCGPTMAPVVRLLRLFAAQEETILLLGPTGAGKSRLARWCHARSPRAAGPFETVDLLSVPAEVQSGELFGWRRGAFTGAVAAHEGHVARARGGTLFLDEIDKLSLAAQASLLQLLETRRYRPLGETAEREADVRFVVGTNADLAEEVREGRFREDLYYRIHVLAVRVPALDDRRDELVGWARVMVARRQAEAVGRGTARLSPDAETALLARRWPGNLRQLDNVLRRAHVLALGDAVDESDVVVDGPHLAASLASEAPGPLGEGGSLVAALAAVAARVVDAARRRAERGEVLDLDEALVLRAFVLADALRRADGDVERAFAWLGREKLVASRNHHKTIERELDRARAFCHAVGEPVPGWLTDALGRRTRG